jgi:adenosylcobinamide-phosphate synthase
MEDRDAEVSALVLAGALFVETRLRLPNALHPVAWFGSVASAIIARAPLAPPALAFGAGLVIALGLPAAVFTLAAFALRATEPLPAVHAALQVLALFSSVALFGLLDAARTVQRALDAGSLDEARAKLSWLCSRDRRELDSSGIANGAIESLAENLSDAVVGPLCALLAFGVEGALAYRAINTLDAMIGYRGKYEWLGKPAARLDDFVNLIPARLTAVLLGLATLTLRWNDPQLSIARGLRTWWRDHAATPSPNGGHPMAMAAGLLGIRLDKPGVYVLGAEHAAPAATDIARALRLVQRAGLLAFACALVCVACIGLRGLYGTA